MTDFPEMVSGFQTLVAWHRVAMLEVGARAARSAPALMVCGDCGGWLVECAHSLNLLGSGAWDHARVSESGRCAGLLSSFAPRDVLAEVAR